MQLKIFFISILLFFLPNFFVRADADEVQKPIKPKIETRKLDQRAKVLADYLSKHNSPLQNHSQDLIDAADQYGLDWKLIPSIAGVESTFGKFIPGGYNAYGWAIYTPDSRYGFKSWKDGIFTVSKGLKEGYVDKGLITPQTMNKTYAASPYWGGKVTFFMNDLNQFSKRYEKKTRTYTNPLQKTVGASAILASDI